MHRLFALVFLFGISLTLQAESHSPTEGPARFIKNGRKVFAPDPASVSEIFLGHALQVMGDPELIPVKAIFLVESFADCIAWAFVGPFPGPTGGAVDSLAAWGPGPRGDLELYRALVKKSGGARQRNCAEAMVDYRDACLSYLDEASDLLRKALKAIPDKKVQERFRMRVQKEVDSRWKTTIGMTWTRLRDADGSDLPTCPNMGPIPPTPSL